MTPLMNNIFHEDFCDFGKDLIHVFPFNSHFSIAYFGENDVKINRESRTSLLSFFPETNNGKIQFECVT